MGGAGAVAVGDGRQTLYMCSQHRGEGLLFRLAQFREFRGDMRHRAVMLTDLHPLQKSTGPTHLLGGGGIPRAGERVGHLADSRREVVLRRSDRQIPRIVSMRRRANARTASSPPISRSWRMAAEARSS